MSKRHESGALQMLGAPDRGLRLAGALRLQTRRAGWLAVRCGRVWITRDGCGTDHVLGEGERLWLPAGAALVAEPWRGGDAAQLHWQHPAAPGRSQARVLPRGAVAPALALGAARVLRAAAGRLLLAARRAEAIACRAQGSICAGDSIASSGALQ